MVPDVASPPQHSKRVEAWVYAVLNPVIESLQREIFLLSKGNLSWRFYSKKCEYIHPIRDYVGLAQRPNYEDFLGDPLNTGFAEQCAAHDRALAEVELKASQFSNGLIHADLFVKQMDESLEEYRLLARTNPLYRYDESLKGTLPRAIAELLVNRIEALPEHYGTAKFWNNYRNKFDVAVEELEPYGERQAFQALVQVREALKELADKLLHDMNAHRQLLCRTFDIPAAPIPVGRSPSHSADIFAI